ncbi:MAG: dTDP-4-dehydrorhamnose 3,5-epimerase [Nitrospiraceae bacterium]
MIFRETELKGVYVIEAEPIQDERGLFSRVWCQREFEAHGLKVVWVQGNVSSNHRAGTLRGLHYQTAPHGESKLVRCTSGSLYDVIVDLRPESPTYLKYLGIELSSREGKMLFIPEGLAHGFQTMEDHTEVSYLMSAFYEPESARGVRWNDPIFDIQWPLAVRIISSRDQSYSDYRPLSC